MSLTLQVNETVINWKFAWESLVEMDELDLVNLSKNR